MATTCGSSDGRSDLLAFSEAERQNKMRRSLDAISYQSQNMVLDDESALLDCDNLNELVMERDTDFSTLKTPVNANLRNSQKSKAEEAPAQMFYSHRTNCFQQAINSQNNSLLNHDSAQQNDNRCFG
jgi:hypothetical protein